MSGIFLQYLTLRLLGKIVHFDFLKERNRVMKFLQLFILVCLASFAFAVDIINEGFEGGVLPAGWQIWQEGPASTVNWLVQTASPHSGTYYIYHGYSGSLDLDNWLVTDTYDCSTYSTATYSLWYNLGYASYYGYTGLLYSTTASPTAADFTEIVEFGNTATSYTEFTGDISAQCAGEANVTFAIQYTGLDAHVVRIDDILIEGFGTALEHDTWGSIKSTF
jgi:hypothetical protein